MSSLKNKSGEDILRQQLDNICLAGGIFGRDLNKYLHCELCYVYGKCEKEYDRFIELKAAECDGGA